MRGRSRSGQMPNKPLQDVVTTAERQGVIRTRNRSMSDRSLAYVFVLAGMLSGWACAERVSRQSVVVAPAGSREVRAGTAVDISKPIDLGRWRETPCLVGRPATQSDVAAGWAAFATSGAESRPIDLGIPRCAFHVDQATGKKTPVILIQAEEAKGLKMVGYRFIGGGDGACLLSELELLDGPERFR